VNILKETLDPTRNSIFEAVIWDVDNELKKFGVASNSQSSSLLEFDTHSESYPDIKMVEYREIRTVRLDSLLVGETIGNFLNLDIQGAELPAIKSLGVRIQEIDFIYTEVNRKELYEKCTRVEELDIYLSDLGFLRKATRWYAREGWGDALYIRESIELNRTLFRKIQFKTGNIRFLLFQFARNAWHSILPTKNRQHPFV
jgi:FkbM family methyltransferase